MALASCRTWGHISRSFKSLKHHSRAVKFIQPVATCTDKASPLGGKTSKHRYSHHPPFPFPEIPTEDAARGFVLHLDQRGRTLLLQELEKFEGKDRGPDWENSEPVSKSQLWEVFMFNGVPFIGFGILDNMVMIVAGEYIDLYIGAMLGISTMAAAALGNLVSDVAGVGSAGYVELMASKLLGIKPPNITPAQTLQRKTRWTVGGGRAAGITIGCIIGMFPLLFFKGRDDEEDTDKADKSSQTEVAKSGDAGAPQGKNTS